jgi:hypothetical protein
VGEAHWDQRGGAAGGGCTGQRAQASWPHVREGTH